MAKINFSVHVPDYAIGEISERLESQQIEEGFGIDEFFETIVSQVFKKFSQEAKVCHLNIGPVDPEHCPECGPQHIEHHTGNLYQCFECGQIFTPQKPMGA